MSENNTELVNNDELKNAHNIYVKNTNTTNSTTNNNPVETTDTDTDDNTLQDNNKLTTLIFLIIMITITTAYYYSILWLIIKTHIIDTITTDTKIITLISGIGCSFYLSILIIKKLTQRKEI